MLGSAARFRGLQEPVLEAMKHKSPISGVAGNSVLFQLPAKSMSSGTTIVITLLVSLQDHIVEQYQQSGISYIKLDSRQCHPASQVVFVTRGSVLPTTPRNTGGLKLKWEYKGKGTKVSRTREGEDIAE
jgi:superfamily II DNA helicase RecQ